MQFSSIQEKVDRNLGVKFSGPFLAGNQQTLIDAIFGLMADLIDVNGRLTFNLLRFSPLSVDILAAPPFRLAPATWGFQHNFWLKEGQGIKNRTKSLN